jgi:hypothetical protein
LKDKSLYPKIEKVISILEKTNSLIELASIKKLSGIKCIIGTDLEIIE